MRVILREPKVEVVYHNGSVSNMVCDENKGMNTANI